MLYVIFVLATTIMANLTLFLPSIKESRKTIPYPRLVADENKYLMLFVLSILTIIFAPLMFIICLSPKKSLSFINSLTAEIKKG